ncbi:cobalamin B12-binding domain-containing protein [Hymenobacter koreensis]|uniref:B12-binding domain-containing protein n=1 Tax=Hymenobacter koreensis TaxID=1084523 RepID=A0ABP8IY84_9BACT
MPYNNSANRERVAHLFYQEANELALAATAHYQQQATSSVDESNVRRQLREHLLPLADAVLMHSPALFETHLLHARQENPGPERDQELTLQLSALRQALLLRLPVAEYVLAAGVLSSGFSQLAEALPEWNGNAAPALPSVNPLQHLVDNYLERLLAADRPGAYNVLLEAAKTGTDVRDLYLQVLQPVQREIGVRWHNGELSVAEEHFCTATTELTMSLLNPYLVSTPRNGRRLVATNVAGDLHAVGLRMVTDFLEHAGWDAYYLGASTPTGSILRTIETRRADLLVLGASLPHHVPLIKELISTYRSTPAVNQAKILVGGQPFNQDPALWRHVGADVWAPDAASAVEVVNRLFGLSEAQPA